MNALDLTAFIARDGEQLITDSRAVAVAFGKRHGDVMRVIERMLQSDRPLIAEHARRNFASISFVDGLNRRQPMYRMTAKGLSELAMGFSGDDSREIRIRFLDAFDEVSARLLKAERSIVEQLHELTRREAPSEVKGRIGSKLMNERRREKPALKEQRDALMAHLQPSLIQ